MPPPGCPGTRPAPDACHALYLTLTTAMARETHFFDAWPDTVNLDELTYGTADASEFYSLLDRLEEASASDGGPAPGGRAAGAY